MAKENRDVRPFLDLQIVQDWFEEHITLQVRPAEAIGTSSGNLDCEPWTTLRIEPRTLATAGISLSVKEDEPILHLAAVARSFATQIGATDENDFSILIIGSTPFLKISDVLERWNFSDLEKLRGGFSLAEAGKPRPRCLQTPHSGFTLELVVVLNKELPANTGYPVRLGTWLARTQFRVCNPAEGIGFTPLTLTDEIREELGIRKQTATHRQIREDQPDLREADKLDDFVAFYVDKDMLDRLATNPRHAQSALKQTEIFIEAIDFLVMEFHRLDDIHEITLGEVDGKLIGRLLRIVSSDDPSDLEAWLEVLKTEPSDFMAAVQAQCNYRDRADDALSLMIREAS